MWMEGNHVVLQEVEVYSIEVEIGDDQQGSKVSVNNAVQIWGYGW